LVKKLALGALRVLGINRLFRHINRGRIKVLLYHHVIAGTSVFHEAVTTNEFHAHLRHLRRRYNVIGLDQNGEWIGYEPTRVNVLVTFDDGFIGNVSTVLPILLEHGVSALFFLIAECAHSGAPPAFANKYADTASAELRTVGPREIRTMFDAGMRIGSHSLSHRDFRTLSDEDALDDARRSRSLLEEIAGASVGTFAFPWGHRRIGHDELVATVYRRIFTTDHGFCGVDDTVIPRNEVQSLSHMDAAASGSLDFFRARLRP
jgi:peptidoglycan/xylan/chitin deacetylase (PgdA/CDA1 family)